MLTEVTASDHTRHAKIHREEALHFFRNRWKTTTLKPVKGIWTLMHVSQTTSRLKHMHEVCKLARAHATMAHRLTTAGLRLIPLER